jgi:hypothetical protein
MIKRFLAAKSRAKLSVTGWKKSTITSSVDMPESKGVAVPHPCPEIPDATTRSNGTEMEIRSRNLMLRTSFVRT